MVKLVLPLAINETAIVDIPEADDRDERCYPRCSRTFWLLSKNDRTWATALRKLFSGELSMKLTDTKIPITNDIDFSQKADYDKY